MNGGRYEYNISSEAYSREKCDVMLDRKLSLFFNTPK